MVLPALKAGCLLHPFPTSPLLTHEIEIAAYMCHHGQVSPGGIHLSAPAAFPPPGLWMSRAAAFGESSSTSFYQIKSREELNLLISSHTTYAFVIASPVNFWDTLCY